MTTEDLSLSLFEALVASHFTIEAVAPDGEAAVALEAQLQRISGRALTAGYEQFSLLFAGPALPLLPQGTYRFRHASLGERLLFMVPVGQNAERTEYEVCVSRKLT